jgi:hypothetical protein
MLMLALLVPQWLQQRPAIWLLRLLLHHRLPRVQHVIIIHVRAGASGRLEVEQRLYRALCMWLLLPLLLPLRLPLLLLRLRLRRWRRQRRRPPRLLLLPLRLLLRLLLLLLLHVCCLLARAGGGRSRKKVLAPSTRLWRRRRHAAQLAVLAVDWGRNGLEHSLLLLLLLVVRCGARSTGSGAHVAAASDGVAPVGA